MESDLRAFTNIQSSDWVYGVDSRFSCMKPFVDTFFIITNSAIHVSFFVWREI
jgi:hypothetical protein